MGASAGCGFRSMFVAVASLSAAAGRSANWADDLVRPTQKPVAPAPRAFPATSQEIRGMKGIAIAQERRNERSAGCRDVVMAKMTQRPVLPAPGERELTAEEIEKLERDELFEPSQRHGLPLMRVAIWPYIAPIGPVDRYLAADFETRLSRAWASAVWRHLIPGSPLRGFSASDPIRLLAHNLDFWLPPVTAAMEEILRDRSVIGETEEGPVPLDDGTILDGAVAAGPRAGGDVWRGEAEAADVVRRTVEAADADGRLRGILDAVLSNRVEDDFSEHWSYAREDFERKLYRKRSKIKIRFVELTDTIPVQGPETKVEDNLVLGDFLALLDERERQIVILLRSGYTKIGDVAGILGYKNHSPVSKRLARIRQKAAEYFGEP